MISILKLAFHSLIGISRGTVCRLVSKGKTLDYSGRVVNLASRLMDDARPSGVVFDASVGIDLLSEEQAKLLNYLAEDRTIGQLMKYVGRHNRTKFRDQVLHPLMEAELVEMTVPEKPRSSKQRYRLAPKGREKVGL